MLDYGQLSISSKNIIYGVFRLIKMSNNDSLLLNISTGPKKKWTPPSLPKGMRNNDKVCSLRMLYSANVK